MYVHLTPFSLWAPPIEKFSSQNFTSVMSDGLLPSVSHSSTMAHWYGVETMSFAG